MTPASFGGEGSKAPACADRLVECYGEVHFSAVVPPEKVGGAVSDVKRKDTSCRRHAGDDGEVHHNLDVEAPYTFEK